VIAIYRDPRSSGALCLAPARRLKAGGGSGAYGILAAMRSYDRQKKAPASLKDGALRWTE